MSTSEATPTISVDDVAEAPAPNADFLLDVRGIDEWLAGHASGTELITLHELPGSLDRLPRDRRIVCICRSGNRSGQATDFLVRHGFDAVNMAGGMLAWAMAGHPIVRLDGGTGAVI
jgi:hydroxyacylglutathione hydrolase